MTASGTPGTPSANVETPPRTTREPRADICVLENVTVAFGGVRALDSVSLTLPSDAGITGIIGPNGAGKSTCLSVIAGARRPTAGHVQVLGRPLPRKTSSTKVARWGVARTFQVPRPFAGLTVRDNVLVAARAHSNRRASVAEAAADDVLERMGLAAVSNQTAGSLALAQRKKLEVARAMAIEPEVILLDEVFEGLSDSEIQDVVSILRGLDSDGIRLVLVEHVIRALRQLAHQLVVFEKGAVIAHGRVDEVLESRRVQEAYLGFGGAS